MKAKLIFDLNESYEKEAFKRASNADGYISLLWDIDQKIRDHQKYDTNLTLDDIREMIHDRINFDEIWS